MIHTLKYRKDIDGLRAIAVSAVVIFHAFPELFSGGFIGVDVFFVISGYLISYLIFQDIYQDKFSLLNFYQKRINRIYPALSIVLFLCLVFGFFALYPIEYLELGKHIFGGAAFIDNILLWKESGYFDTSTEVKPLLHLWSLSLEEQFYIIWPITLYIAWKYKHKVIIISIILIISFLCSVLYSKQNPSMSFFFLHTRSWELIFGALLAYVHIFHGVNSLGKYHNIFSIVGILLLIVGFFYIGGPNQVFPGWIALIPVLGACLIIASPSAYMNRVLLSSKVFVLVGLISYPLYLWHWPLLSFLQIINGTKATIISRILAVALAIILSIVTYFWIERPLRSWKSNTKTYILFLLVFIIGVAGGVVYIKNGLPNRSSVQLYEGINAQFTGTSWEYSQNDICMNNHPFPDSINYWWWFCMQNNDSPPQILLAGNSFANHLYSGVVVNPNVGQNTTVLSVGACGIDFEGIQPEGDSPCSSDRPLKQKEFLKNTISKNSDSLQMIIMNGLYDDPYAGSTNVLMEFLEFVHQFPDIQLVVFLPHIKYQNSLKACFARPFKDPEDDCILDISLKNDLDKKYTNIIQLVKEKYPEVIIYNQNEVFCDEDKATCSLKLDGLPIFRDEYSHFSKYASEKVMKDFFDKHANDLPKFDQ